MIAPTKSSVLIALSIVHQYMSPAVYNTMLSINEVGVNEPNVHADPNRLQS